MSVTYLVGFKVKAEQHDRFRRLLDAVLDAMREEESFRNATLHRHPDDPFSYLLHESWADHEEVLEVQLKRPYRAEWHAALPELLEQPRDISMWVPIRADGQIMNP
ncbi:putative quinol monooxygenase [Sphingosinicella sp. BN140058]|uniref:putative quinol monooxygenase n=1 Tax=Sphingosinicella sp. BN140058 TaxID=1892855 RepID=UPI00101316BA|nr:putative quinol monooxygenase [Sphingosinicella sp. BN140058]QAY75299.1 antibiotic biosynthesis monooxygenase [Sphingosinicella sp. BN140058]